jgi:hypothetical protein
MTDQQTRMRHAVIRAHFSRPATAGEMEHLKAQILVAMETRANLARIQPTIEPLGDQAILAIGFAQWLGGDAADVIAALRGE